MFRSASLLSFATTVSLGAFGSVAFAADPSSLPADSSPSILAPWPTLTGIPAVTHTLAQALPVAGNKADIDNSSLGFFRQPDASELDVTAILYVGLLPETAPQNGEFVTPLYSGSIESFRLGTSVAPVKAPTYGDIGDIDREGEAPQQMAYIVYRLDFGSEGGPVSLFATPKLACEPITVNQGGQDLLGSRYAWEGIRFKKMVILEDHDVDWHVDMTTDAGRIAPEPTSAALIALGLGALGMVRRRK
jgi:hypothetical protein